MRPPIEFSPDVKPESPWCSADAVAKWVTTVQRMETDIANILNEAVGDQDETIVEGVQRLADELVFACHNAMPVEESQDNRRAGQILRCEALDKAEMLSRLRTLEIQIEDLFDTVRQRALEQQIESLHPGAQGSGDYHDVERMMLDCFAWLGETPLPRAYETVVNENLHLREYTWDLLDALGQFTRTAARVARAQLEFSAELNNEACPEDNIYEQIKGLAGRYIAKLNEVSAVREKWVLASCEVLRLEHELAKAKARAKKAEDRLDSAIRNESRLICGGSGFVARKMCIGDGFGEVDSCPRCDNPAWGSGKPFAAGDPTEPRCDADIEPLDTMSYKEAIAMALDLANNATMPPSQREMLRLLATAHQVVGAND